MNINRTITTGLCLMAAGSFAFAEGEASVFSNDGESAKRQSVEAMSSKNDLRGAISIRAGYMGVKGSDSIVDDGFGGQVEIKFALAESPFDLVLRGYGANVESDDDEIWVSDPNLFYYRNTLMAEAIALKNIEETIYGGSFQLQFNLARGATVNPYVAAGVMYEKSEVEFDVGYAVTDGRHIATAAWHEKMDEDGFAFVGRAGIEFSAESAYVRLEAAAVTEIYDDDGTQAELNAIVGANVSDNVRLELSGTYFTEWEEYYILGGITFLF